MYDYTEKPATEGSGKHSVSYIIAKTRFLLIRLMIISVFYSNNTLSVIVIVLSHWTVGIMKTQI